MKSFSPTHKVIIRALRDGIEEAYDISRDVITIQTNKAYGRGSGGWQITTTARFVEGGLRWCDILKPNDIVEITLSRGGVGDKPVAAMKGMIDRVSLSQVAAAEGLAHRTVKICGQDMCKLLLVGEIGWDISPAKFMISTTESYWANFLRRMKFISGTPPKLIQDIMDFMAEEIYLIPLEMKWDQYITSDDNWTTFNKEAYLMEQTSIWQAMKRYENAPWNVLWCDTADSGRFCVGLERQPLDGEGRVLRGKDKTVSMSQELMISSDLGVSDSERINLMVLYTDVMTFFSKGNGMELAFTQRECTQYEEASIWRNGYLPRVFESYFWPPEFVDATTKEGKQAVTSAVKPRVDTMWEWVRRNHEYSAGTMTVKGDPRIRAGWKLIDEATGMSYLVEQVSHEYSVFPMPRFVTTLQLTRGQKVKAGTAQ